MRLIYRVFSYVYLPLLHSLSCQTLSNFRLTTMPDSVRNNLSSLRAPTSSCLSALSLALYISRVSIFLHRSYPQMPLSLLYVSAIQYYLAPHGRHTLLSNALSPLAIRPSVALVEISISMPNCLPNPPLSSPISLMPLCAIALALLLSLYI